MYIGDYGTRYLGHYSEDGLTAYLTSYTGGGTAYIFFFGFDSSILGKEVIVTCDNPNIGFTNRTFTISQSGGESYYNLDGTYLGRSPIGILIRNTWILQGTYNITLTYDGRSQNYKIIKTF